MKADLINMMAGNKTQKPNNIVAPAQHNTGQVQSLNRAISIMRFIAANPQGVRLSDIAANLHLAPSTVHRLLTSLSVEKFVRTDSVSGHWHIGIDAFTVGNGFIQSKNVLLFAQTRLRDLVRNYSETASIYLENEGEMVCMHQYESHNMIRAITRVGGRVKMHNSGAGKAVLAFWENEDIETIVRIHGLTQDTEKTISSLQSLKNDLKQVRKLGYAVDYEEAALGVCCIAAPIFNHQAKSIAAVSVSGPLTRMNKVKLTEIAKGVKEAANQLSQEVGAHLVGFSN